MKKNVTSEGIEHGCAVYDIELLFASDMCGSGGLRISSQRDGTTLHYFCTADRTGMVN